MQLLPFLQDKIKAGSVAGPIPEVTVAPDGSMENTTPEAPISEQPIMGTDFKAVLQSIVMRYLSRMK